MKTGVIAAVVLALVGAGGLIWLVLERAPESMDAGALSSSEETRRLDRGEVLITRLEPTGGHGVAARAQGVIDAPVSAVWPVVRDCQDFDQFMPRTKNSALRHRDGDTLLCYAEIDLPWPLGSLQLETRSRIKRPRGDSEPIFERSWTLTKGSFEHHNGSFRVAPFEGDPQRTLMTYTVDANPSMPVPDAVLRRAQAKAIPKIFAKVAIRAGARRP